MKTLPRGVWALGVVSLLMDASSELVHSLLPLFLAGVLGASMATIGAIEGVAEATAALTKVFSGALSDYFRRRKPLTVLGYGLAALTKPVFPLAASIGWVFAARFADRVGKGIRGAPRDALVADITPPELRGAAYGLRQALDSAGAVLGPALAVAFMLLLANDLRAVMWVAVAPAFLAVAVLVVGVREPEERFGSLAKKKAISFAGARHLGSAFWMLVLMGAVFTLARFSEAFLVLRAQSAGLREGLVPLVMVAMSLVFALSAYPAGALADRMDHRRLLMLGCAVLVLADLILAAADSPALAFAGAGVWGLHMGITQGLFSKLVADHAPPQLRGSAFGVFNLVSGGALLAASVVAGLLWDAAGPRATFYAGAALAAAAALLSAWRPAPPRGPGY